MEYEIIAACDLNGAIGKDGGIPWHLPEDLQHFKQITTQTRAPDKKNVVIMGRRTWESLRGKPLPGRINIVMSTVPSDAAGVIWVNSYEEAIKQCENLFNDGVVDKAFIIGGNSLYTVATRDVRIRCVHLTLIAERFSGCDTFFPLNQLSTLGFAEDQECTQRFKNETYNWTYMLLLRLPGESSVSS